MNNAVLDACQFDKISALRERTGREACFYRKIPVVLTCIGINQSLKQNEALRRRVKLNHGK